MADLPFKFLCLPAAIPIPAVITSPFGERKHPKVPGNPRIEHRGLDIRAKAGTAALAVFDGEVISAGLLSANYNTGCGEGIVIGHFDGNQITHTTKYCHFERGSTAGLVRGTRIRAGQRIGTVGNTGGSTAPHLHFELRRVRGNPDRNPDGSWRFFSDVPIDPTPYIRAFEQAPTDYANKANAQASQRLAASVGISPLIESLESFHPKIQYELTRRRIAAETANVYTPFVKLTSLSKVLKSNLETETVAYCPSLGLHGQNSVAFDDIYSTRSDKSIIGYAINNDGTQDIPVIVADASKDAKNIPVPGIASVEVERSTAGPMGVRGGLTKADLKIVAYSVGQVDALLRYFLRPATRVVLELGRMSSNQTHPNERFTPFDWKSAVGGKLKIGNTPVDVKTYFSTLIKDRSEQEKFIKQYVYDNYGNYELFIAYVVKFNLKYNKNNTYEISLTMHSVQQVEVPTKHTGVQSTCPSPTSACKAMDILEYFNDTYSWKTNSFAKLMSYYQQENLIGDDYYWSNQAIPIKNEKSEPDATSGPSTQAGTRENEYFVSWRFFVEKILNDKRYGIAAMLGNDELANLTLLRPTDELNESDDTGLIANQVGYHPNLRSVNPEVMIIWNPAAQTSFSRTTDNARFTSIIRLAGQEDETIRQALEKNDLLMKITRASEPFSPKKGEETKASSSSLTKGIWLNTKAIKQAFTSTDTISAAISMLLNMMNSATEGYWNLQLYSTDVKNPGMHIIDMGLSKEPKILTESTTINGVDEENFTSILDSTTGVNLRRYHGETEDKPKFIYMFNRGTKRFGDGELGSDLLDLNVEFNLPQVIAVQAIANIGGPAQKSTLESINIPELQEITLLKDLYKPCNDTNICVDEQECESDEIQEFTRAVEIARQAETDVIAQERRAPRATDAQAFASEARLSAARVNRQAAEDRLAEVEIKLFNPNLVGTIREYADLGTAVRLIEINPSRMMKQLNIDSTNAERQKRPPTAHAFNSSNLTKTVVDVTLPGIGGINLFQSFLVDRVPSIIDRGFYVVTKIGHEFNPQNGWVTKIQGRFRYRPKKVSSTDDKLC